MLPLMSDADADKLSPYLSSVYRTFSPMLRLSRHKSTSLVRTLCDQGVTLPGALSTAARSSLNCRRDLVTSAPHANGDRSRTRLCEASRRRVIRPGEGTSQLAWTPVVSSTTQWRGLAAGGGGKKDGGGSGKDDGMFDRLKKTFEEEVEKNPNLKENLSKLKEMEQKFRDNPNVKENLSRLREAEQKFRDNPSVKENLSKLKDAEKKLRDDAKSKQGEFVEQAEKARERAQQSGGIFQEKFQEFKQALEEKLGKAGGASTGGDGEGQGGAENEFVRASKQKFSGAQKALDENSVFAKVRARGQAFRDSLAGASSELFSSSDGKQADSAMAKKLKQPKKRKEKKKAAAESGEQVEEEKKEEEEEDDEEEEEKGGVRSLMIVKTAGEAWDRMRERMKDSPIIQELLGASKVVASGTLGKGAKAAKDRVQDKVGDVQEAWDTSQHPMVYKVSSAWDSVTAESDMAIGIKELRRLDPSFHVEDWKADIQELFLPEFMSAFLRGDLELLKQWTAEAVFKKIASEITQRNADGDIVDPNVLDIENVEVITVRSEAGKGSPSILVHFMCQQIKCVRNRKGEVTSGAEDSIHAVYYLMSFQRDFDDKEAELRWSVTDMSVIGEFPYY